MDPGKIIFCVLCCVLGGPILGIGLNMFRRTIHLMRKGARTVGYVSGHYKDPDPENDLQLEIVFDHAGVEQHCRIPSDKIRLPRVNDSIRLIYDPANPKVVFGVYSDQLWVSPAILSVLGSSFILIGFAPFLKH